MSSQDRKDRAAIAQAESGRLLPSLDELAGPAAPISEAAQQALVSAALDTAFPLPPSPPSPASPPATSAGPSVASSAALWARRGFLLGGGVAIVGAGAALWLRSLGLRRSAPGPTVLAGKPAGTAASTQPTAVSAPREPAPASPAPAAQPLAPAPTASTAEPSSPARASSARKGGDASDLLLRANERRRQQRFAEAAALYQQVLGRYPGSEAAYVARVSAGMLYVERLRDPGRAQRLFQAALKQQPHGALNEEARLGLADAWRALGNPTQERAALQAFLQHHPQALARPHAERRLRLLEAR